MSHNFRFAVAVLFAVSGTAFADQFYFESPGTVTWNGVYVNPYTVKDNTTGQNPLTVYCDDWNTDFSGNPTWNANVYSLTAGNVSHFKYGNTTSNYNVTLSPSQDYLSISLSSTPNAFNRYLEAAWLDNQWRTLGGSAQTQIALAAAEWTLFVDTSHAGSPLNDPTSGLIGAINTSGYAKAVYNYLQDAQTAVAGGYTAPGWDVIVPANNSFPMQEFLVYGYTPPVPEPSAVLLLATVVGLLTFSTLRRRRAVR